LLSKVKDYETELAEKENAGSSGGGAHCSDCGALLGDEKFCAECGSPVNSDGKMEEAGEKKGAHHICDCGEDLVTMNFVVGLKICLRCFVFFVFL